MMQKILPAILTDDIEELRSKLALLEEQSEWVHIDIMDGKFVSRASLSVDALKEFAGQFLFEVHLMVANPANYFDACQTIGAKRVVWHSEAIENLDDVLRVADAYSFERGVALRPETNPGTVESFLSRLNFVLLLGVEPGAQGNPFIPAVLEKAKLLKGKVLVGIDGGVNKKNIPDVFQAGADYAVVGSAIWKSENPADVFREMQKMIE